jgi:hypothetical protein
MSHRPLMISLQVKTQILLTTVAGRSGGYSAQFWALYFLQQVSKVDALTSAYIVGAGSRGAVPPDNFARAVCIDYLGFCDG